MSQGLLTVMAGYCTGPSIPRSTQLWVEALRRHSRHLLVVFDNPAPTQLPEAWDGPDLTLLFERHGAYDFGSYRRGLELAEDCGWLAKASHVLLCNDSVLGPLGDLGPLLQRMQAAPDQAWGLTASHQLAPHLQSYFVLLGRELLERAPLQRFVDSIEPLPSRYAVIQRYELGLSRALLAAGAQLRAWVEPQQLLDPRTAQPAGNPAAFPLSLVELGVPLIKARALRECGANQEGIAASCRLIAERNPELWQALWADAPHRRFWQEQLRIGVLLGPADLERLPERLSGLERQAHPSVQLFLPVPMEARQLRARLARDYAREIARGLLQVLPLVEGALHEQRLHQAVTLADADLLCRATDALWQEPLALSLQVRQMAAEPTLAHSTGQPRLWRRDWLLSQPVEGLHRLAESIG